MSPKPAPDRKKEILDAALTVFSKKGFEGSRTKEIAAQAHLSEATIFKYFPSKKHLLSALIEPFLNTVLKPMMMESIQALVDKADGQNIRPVLRDIMQDRIRLIRRHHKLVVTLILEAARNREILESMRTVVLPQINLTLSEIFKRAHQAGTVRPMEIKVLIRSFLSLLAGYIMFSGVFPDELTLGDDDRDIEAMLDLYFDGIALRGSNPESKHPEPIAGIEDRQYDDGKQKEQPDESR